MESAKKTVVITSSSGLLGSAFAKRLAERFQVVGFDRESHPYPPPAAIKADPIHWYHENRLEPPSSLEQAGPERAKS